MNEIEIMAPVGSFSALSAAIKSGAKSVYFGVGNLNMRARSSNFEEKDLAKIVKICNNNKIKSYLTLNTIVYDEEIKIATKLIKKAKKAGITAIIASDISIIQICKGVDIEVHLSTQCNVTNIDAVKFYSQFCDVIVLSRELNLKQIKYICAQIKSKNIVGPSGELVKIELFIHGALCVAISGKCYMSLSQYNQSANRGRCLQACRREYKVIDNETGEELVVNNKFVMSPSDLCTIEILDEIIASGVSILKIEGRGRGAEYVDLVVRVYNRALDLIKEKKYTKQEKIKLINELKTVFNRGFWKGGYYLGEKVGEWSGVYGSKATKIKKTLGVVVNYFSKSKVAQIKINTGKLEIGDTIMIIGPTTGVISLRVTSLYINEKESNIAKKGDDLTVKINDKVRKNDEVFILKNVI